ncbi:MAG: SRPBCC family protein [Candidatus Limnocylindria bacterium]
MGARYSFSDVWTVDAPIDVVWTALNAHDWTTWWPDYRRIELVRIGGDDGVGWIGRVWVRSNLPYTLVFTIEIVEVDPPRFVRTRVEGFFSGEVSWTLETDTGGGARLTLREEVETTWPLINVLTRLGFRGLFEANHARAMRRGERGLRRLLASERSAEPAPGHRAVRRAPPGGR